MFTLAAKVALTTFVVAMLVLGAVSSVLPGQALSELDLKRIGAAYECNKKCGLPGGDCCTANGLPADCGAKGDPCQRCSVTDKVKA